MAGGWKATALKAEVWVDTVTEGGWSFMATWRKEEVDTARHRTGKREATRLGKLLSHTEAWNFVKRHPSAKPTSRRNPCMDARRTETCVAPRHKDASRDIYFIFSQRAAWRAGAARLFLFLFPCPADLERD